MDIMALILAKKAAAKLVADNGEWDKKQQQAIDEFMIKHTEYERTMQGLAGNLDTAFQSINSINKDAAAHKVDPEAHKALFDAQKSMLDEHTALYEAHIKAFEEQIATRDAEILALQNTDSEIKKDAQALANRVHNIENDYLTSSDKEGLIADIETAKQTAIETILGGVVEADFDTLKEVAAWIQSDTTNSAALIARVDAIQNDYVTKAEKAELAKNIKAITDDYLTSADKAEFEATHAAINLTLGQHTTKLSDIESNIGVVKERISVIEKDYLKAADRYELSERIKAITDDYLVEADKDALEVKIKAITDDYLKSTDKELLIATADKDRAYFNGEIARIDKDYMTKAEKQELWDYVNTVTYHLPKITDADKDKFLKAVDGKWTFVEMKFQKIYVGNAAPASDLGVNGDVYIQTE